MEYVIVVFAVLLIVILWIVLYDSNRFVVRFHSVSDERIKKGFRAVFLSDLHNKKFGKENEKLLESIDEQNPDVIFIAGDMLAATPGRDFAGTISFLEKLSAKYPIYYGNGNHEHRTVLYPETYGDMGERCNNELTRIGISPLVNDKIIIDDANLAVCGLQIDREYYKRFRVTFMDEYYLKEKLGASPEQYCILLAHNPDYFERYADWGADLVLAGHVHGGVARVPFWGKGVLSPSLRLFPKYDGGIFKWDKSVMILNRGLGMHTIPVRVFNPGEYWVIDFCKMER